ncbi:MAG: SDR family NAD(P)-dependent oxidoreductase [Pseudomonadota bacterium]
MDHPHPNRPWALVTGASAGLGAEFARQLAARGHSLVLVARREDRLQALARELRERHGAASLVVALDLSGPAAGAALFARTEAAGIVVDYLVNNAGYGLPGTLTHQPWEAHRAFIEVMVAGPVDLCWRYLPGMRERRRGHVVNVASLAGLVPGSAGHTLYGASTAWLIKFSQSLALENAPLGIKVCALCPGFTYSEFHDVNGARAIVSKMPKYMWMDAAPVVAAGIAAVERGEVVCVPGRVNRFIKFLIKHLPDGMALRMTAKRSKEFRVQDGAAG